MKKADKGHEDQIKTIESTKAKSYDFVISTGPLVTDLLIFEF